MLHIEEKKDCCGCAACYNICPQNAIEMIEDEEGFLYPKINKEKCIKCGICEKICPIKNKRDNKNEVTKAYIGYNENAEIRDSSTSGGIFSSLAERIIELGGVVFGASYDSNFNVIHTYSETKEELKKFRGSKYVQSKIGISFQNVKDFLEDNRYVLFSGTPCQIYGLKSYLKKDYEKLYCVDLVCHGVPSPEVVKKYIEYQEEKYNSKITYMSYREKTYGATSSTMTLKFKNGKKYDGNYEMDFILNAFLKGYISRPSCYECNFKTITRISDITLGDAWNAEKLKPIYKNRIGNTAIFVHSEKGEKLLSQINNIFIKKEDLDEVIRINANGENSMITYSAELPNERAEFFNDFNKKNMREVMNKYTYISLNIKLKMLIKKNII